MKRLAFLISFSICCTVALAQPTSFGGITPGKTTREELRNLLQNPDKLNDEEKYFILGKLKELSEATVSGDFQGETVYRVNVSIFNFTEFHRLLIEKYGVPKIKVGQIKNVTCQNNLGASFKRLQGYEELRWPAKDGVQGVITRLAGNCGEVVFENYELRHLATVKAVEKESQVAEKKASDENRRKLQGAF